MKKNIFFIAACISVFLSCKKSDDTPAPEIHINFSNQALDYVQIPANKYFIYKDSISGNTDSVIVSQSVLATRFMPAYQSQIDFGFSQREYYYQTFTLLLSKVQGSTSSDWFYGIAKSNIFPFPGNTDSAGLMLLEKDRSVNWEKGYVFSYPTGKQNIISKITIEGKDYSDVIQFTNNSYQSPSSPDYFTSTYYWAKGIGIIKRSLTTSVSTKTWTLLRKG